MPHRRTTFSKFIIEDQRRRTTGDAELTALLNDVQTACKFVASAVSRGQIDHSRGLAEVANEIVLRECEWGGGFCAMLSAEANDPYVVPATYPRGRYLLVFDPLDGASNLDVNVPVGTIFAILRAPGRMTEPTPGDFLQPGTQQVAAGYALYGPAATIVMTLGSGVHGFTLDREIGAYTLTHPDMRIPEETRDFAINASNERFWEPPVQHYVEECIKGSTGDRGEDFSMRWVDSVVAEVQRILLRGGLFVDPRDTKDSSSRGRLHLLYEANPMAMIVEQAGGGASTGRGRILEVVPTDVHERVPAILGSRREVERLVEYHETHDRGEKLGFAAPLFNSRSLFRTP